MEQRKCHREARIHYKTRVCGRVMLRDSSPRHVCTPTPHRCVELRDLARTRRAAAAATTAEGPDFNREVRPILSNYCFKCHGPDDKTRKAKLRLDVRESALREADSGLKTIVPGQPDESEVIVRIFSKDPDEVMPPPSMKKDLTAAQRDILKRWIAAGAEYQPHWAFVKPQRPAVPELSGQQSAVGTRSTHSCGCSWRAEADALARGRSPHADPPRFIRSHRTAADCRRRSDAFVNDQSPDAYEQLVDRLLASPHYGERWARRWLDLARYADTNGYEKDRERSIWPYRDWVINALNADMPFDQFTIEQTRRRPAARADAASSSSPPAFIATRCSTKRAASIRWSFATTR